VAERHKVASIDDIAPNDMKIFSVAGKEIVISRADGGVQAFSNACVHRGGPLGEGDLQGCVVTCPWHGWQFNVQTGESVMNAQIKHPVYPVTVEGKDIYVEL
jgi:nitrite reductase (NADH) small subunit